MIPGIIENILELNSALSLSAVPGQQVGVTLWACLLPEGEEFINISGTNQRFGQRDSAYYWQRGTNRSASRRCASHITQPAIYSNFLQ